MCLDKRTFCTHARFSGVLKYFRESESYKCLCARACFIVLYEKAGFASGNTNGRNAITQSVSALRSPCIYIRTRGRNDTLACARSQWWTTCPDVFAPRCLDINSPLHDGEHRRRDLYKSVPMNPQRVLPINFSELTANKRRTRPYGQVRRTVCDRNVH